MPCIPCQKNKLLLDMAKLKKQREAIAKHNEEVNKRNTAINYFFDISPGNNLCCGADIHGNLLTFSCDDIIEVYYNNRIKYKIQEGDSSGILKWKKNCKDMCIQFSPIRDFVKIIVMVIRK